MEGMVLADSDEERLRKQMEELVARRDYDAALRFAVREADNAYERQRYAQGIDVLNVLVQLLKDRQVALWNIYISAYQKIVGLDNQLGNKSATIRDLIELSRYCVKDGDFDKALSASNSAVGIDARCTEALNQKARVLAYRRDYAQAFNVLEQSLEVSPRNPRTLYLKASILGDNGKFAEALALFEQLRMTEPSYPGIGKAIAEMRRQIDWKLKTVDGPVSGMRASHSSQLDRVPAIQRKAKSTDPDDTTRNTLETLYDEAVVAEPCGPVEQSPTAVRNFVPSEAAGLTVMSPEELRLASLRREQEPEAFTAPASPPLGQEAERQLIGMLRDISQGTMEREDLMQRLSNAESATMPLSLGALYFNFLRSPQDAEAMSDLLTWLGHSGYTRLPLFIVAEAAAQGVRIDFHDPQIASIVLSVDSADMAVELRTRKAEFLLERGDTASYVREELGMVHRATKSASPEGIVRQFVQIIEHSLAEDACTQEVLATAMELGVLD